METIIEFKNVTKQYPRYHAFTGGLKHFLFTLPSAMAELRRQKFTAFQDVSFAIRRGESTAFIGRNGAGKSTTLGLIAGVMRPTCGEVIVRGRVSPLLELGGGFHPELSGVENVRLNGVLLGLSRKEVARKLSEIVEFSELKEFIHQPIRTYSSGMLARLGFSVVAHLDPEILLVDEVLAVGDAPFQKKCMEKMQDFRRRGVTLVLVSHSIGDVKAICDRAIWIDQHRIRRDGPAVEVAEEYSLA